MAIVRPSAPRATAPNPANELIARALARVDTITAIPVNDGEAPPSPAAVSGARALVHALGSLQSGWGALSAIFITRTDDGAVQFEWHDASRYAEAIIRAPDCFDLMIENESGAVEMLVESPEAARQKLDEHFGAVDGGLLPAARR